MGHLKKKYTKEYFLGSVDKEANRKYGVDGYESFKQGRLDERYLRFLGGLSFKGKVVLDIGCGRGEIVDYAAKRGCKKVYGIDFSKEAIEIASKFNKDNANAELIEMEARDIGFKDTFDIVFMMDVIEHIPDEEMQLVYSKVHAALKERGILVLYTPFYRSSEDKDDSDFISATQGMHCNKQTKQKLNSDLRKHNFRKYSLNIWGKPEKWSLPIFLYAKKINLKDSLSVWVDRLTHPKRTISKLYKEIMQ